MIDPQPTRTNAMLPDDIAAQVATMTAEQFCERMTIVWESWGGEIYDRFHDANMLAKAMQLELVNTIEYAEDVDHAANVWRLPCGQSVIVATHGNACCPTGSN